MKHTSHTKALLAPTCIRRSILYRILLIFVVLILIIMTLYSAQLATTSEQHDSNGAINGQATSTVWNINAMRACLLPDVSAPTNADTCVLMANGAVHVAPGKPSNPDITWKKGECDATLRRLAPWIQGKRPDLAAAPPLVCGTRGRPSNSNMPLFAVQKTPTSYNVTEPLWASLMIAPTKAGRNKKNNNNDNSECPDVYLTSITYGFGRTFNQIQSILASLWLSKVLKRTFVFPHLTNVYGIPLFVADVNGSYRTPFEHYFNVEKLRRAGYCIIDYASFEANIRRRFPDEKDRKVVYYENASIGYYRHLFRSGFMDAAPLLAHPTGMPVAPLKFSVSFGTLAEILPSDDASRARLPSVPLIVLDNLISFHMQAPFDDFIRIFGLLEPSPAVASVLDEMWREQSSGQTIALHLRNREGAGKKEQNLFHWFVWPPTKHSELPLVRSTSSKKSIIDECTYTADQAMEKVHFAMKHLLIPSSSSATNDGSTNVSILLATDNQRKEEIAKLQEKANSEHIPIYMAGNRGNVTGNFTAADKEGLGVIVDFFLLVRADVFFGNRLSSISQSACLTRLGQGRACYGVPAGHFRSVFFPDAVHIQHI